VLQETSFLANSELAKSQELKDDVIQIIALPGARHNVNKVAASILIALAAKFDHVPFLIGEIAKISEYKFYSDSLVSQSMIGSRYGYFKDDGHDRRDNQGQSAELQLSMGRIEVVKPGDQVDNQDHRVPRRVRPHFGLQ